MGSRENQALVLKYQAGDPEAADQLLAVNAGLIYGTARRFVPPTGFPELEDLVIEGQLGLLEAAGRWDHRRGFAFVTLASYYVYQRVSRHAKNSARIIRLPIHAVDTRTQSPLWASVVASLDAPVGEDGEKRLLELMADPEDLATLSLSRLTVAAGLERLSVKEREVIRRRFVLQQTLSEVGQHFGVGRERVRQIEARGLEKLRQQMAR